jgi:hypothetical protein
VSHMAHGHVFALQQWLNAKRCDAAMCKHYG